VDVGSAHEQSERLRRTGQTIMFLAIDAQLAGILAAGDPPKNTGWTDRAANPSRIGHEPSTQDVQRI
jgi:hypothetical protein